MKRLLTILRAVLPLALFIAALWILRKELTGVDWKEVLVYLRELSAATFAFVIAATALSYAALTLYDYFGTRYARFPLSWSTVAPASFIAYAFTHALGHPLLTGTPVRIRFYGVAGLNGAGIARIVSYCFVGFWLGFTALGGLVFTFAPLTMIDSLPLHQSVVRPLGVLMIVITIGYLLACTFVRRTISIRDWVLRLPSSKEAIVQLTIASLDWILAAAVFLLILPRDTGISPLHVGAAFLLANSAGLLSQVPGGVGVFETVILISLEPFAPSATILGALVIYRGIYYLVPLIGAVALLAWSEFRHHRHHILKGLDQLERVAPEFIPAAFAIGTFAAGTILLLTGAGPNNPRDMTRLASIAPLGAIEVAHFVASLAGVSLLVLARGLQHRLAAAWKLSLAVLGIATISAIVRGLDLLTALLMIVMMVTLTVVQREFYRRAPFSEAKFTPGGAASVLMVMAATVWLTFLGHSQADYSSAMLSQFAIDGHAPRALRALFGVSLLSLGASISLLLTPRSGMPGFPEDAELTDISKISATFPRAFAHRALLGDKQVLFHHEHDAFIMFNVRRRSWVSFGDPVGPPERAAELAWAFRNLAVRNGGRPVFYRISDASIPRCLDMGLAVIKLGYEARIKLDPENLERAHLDEEIRFFSEANLDVDVVRPDDVLKIKKELDEVASLWLTSLTTVPEEDPPTIAPGYLEKTPVVVVRKGERIVAFAALWMGADGGEVSVDLIRHLPYMDAAAVLKGLTAWTINWAAGENYSWVSLGLAPSMDAERPLRSKAWNDAANVLYRHGEHFQNFEALREFEQRFNPELETVSVATPGGLEFAFIFRDILKIISSGARGGLGRGVDRNS